MLQQHLHEAQLHPVATLYDMTATHKLQQHRVMLADRSGAANILHAGYGRAFTAYMSCEHVIADSVQSRRLSDRQICGALQSCNHNHSWQLLTAHC